jgi:hypothetical protein
MLAIILSAVVGIAATLALSWVVSAVGFHKLVNAGAPSRAVAWTNGVGKLTGAVVALEVVVALVAFFVLVVFA